MHPWFRQYERHADRNQIGFLEIGGEIGVRVERVSRGWRRPRLQTVIEQKLL